MAPQSGPSLPPVIVGAPQQRAVGLECCGDTGVPAAQEGALPPAAHEVTGCSPSDAPPQTGPRDDLDSEGLDMCGGEGSLGTPGERKRYTVKPPNKGHLGTGHLSLVERLSSSQVFYWKVLKDNKLTLQKVLL